MLDTFFRSSCYKIMTTYFHLIYESPTAKTNIVNFFVPFLQLAIHIRLKCGYVCMFICMFTYSSRRDELICTKLGCLFFETRKRIKEGQYFGKSAEFDSQ
jgi:hypothetical protein